uniref:Uncharacterized protein n=1 Tax=Anguilla anguilla TaxID=7936 RepID=A0A0E9SYD4_ANGAN
MLFKLKKACLTWTRKPRSLTGVDFVPLFGYPGRKTNVNVMFDAMHITQISPG